MLLELLVASAVLGLSLAAFTVLDASNLQAVESTVLGQTVRETTLTLLADQKLRSSNNFLNITSTSSPGSTLLVADISPCAKELIATTTRQSRYGIKLSASYSEIITDVTEAQKQGGECPARAPSSISFTNLTYAATLATGSTTTIREHAGILYIGISQAPYIVLAKQNATGPLTYFPIPSSFSLPEQANDFDVVTREDGGLRKIYLYAALASTTAQLGVYDVTDPSDPHILGLRNLNGVISDGSYPQGWRIRAYDDRLYITTRETNGPEFHVFDISTPSNPLELGRGTKIGITINDFAVRDQVLGGVTHRYLYAATDRSSGELAVYEVTDPENDGSISEIPSLRQDLPGIQNASSVALLGNRVYLGRESVPSGPDLYTYNLSDIPANLILEGTTDVGAGILQIIPTGNFVFLATTKSGKQLQAWNMFDPQNAQPLGTYTLPRSAARGMEFDGYMLSAVGSTPSLVTFSLP